MRKIVFVQATNVLMIILMTCILTNMNNIIGICERPACIFRSGDLIDNKYIVETAINDTQLYARMPDDNAVLLMLTVKANKAKIPTWVWVSISSTTEDMKDYIIIEKIEGVSS